GVMVTGSHNPRDQNGFKLLLSGAASTHAGGGEPAPIYGSALRALVAIDPVLRGGGNVCELAADSGAGDVRHPYVSYLAAMAADTPDLDVVWDCGSGAVGSVIAELTANLRGHHTLLNARVDGRFPAHHPDPSVAENLRELQATVLAQRADVGIAF